MQTDNKLFDDLARVASGVFDAFSGVREEVESRVRLHVEAVLVHLNLVTREDYEAVLAMAVAAREAQESLAERVAKLEAQLHSGEIKPKKSTSAAPRSGKSKAAEK